MKNGKVTAVEICGDKTLSEMWCSYDPEMSDRRIAELSKFIHRNCPSALPVKDWIASGNGFDPQMQLNIHPDYPDSILAFEMTLRVFGAHVRAVRISPALGGFITKFEVDPAFAGPATRFYNRLPERITTKTVANLMRRHPELQPMAFAMLVADEIGGRQ